MKATNAILLVLSLQISIQAHAENWSDWMTFHQYEEEFNRQLNERFYPHAIEGQCQEGVDTFRAEWLPLPSGGVFRSHNRMDIGIYDSKNQEYSSQGFTLVYRQRYADCAGVDRYQATWLKAPSDSNRDGNQSEQEGSDETSRLIETRSHRGSMRPKGPDTDGNQSGQGQSNERMRNEPPPPKPSIPYGDDNQGEEVEP